MIFKRIVSLILCILSILSLSSVAFAEETEEVSPIFDEEELLEMTEKFIEGHHVKAENFSVGFVYTATGDTWYYNENKWYYSASMYKVPLMMLYAEMEAAGELTQESNIKGLTLAQAEQYILTFSNNDYAHLMMDNLGGDRYCRETYQKYSTLPKEDYDPDYYDYSYYTARFMTDVMKTLYYENERFPNIIESIMHAQDDMYFELNVRDYEVAQKYGAYKEFYHNTGIIYTPNPIILTVMTKNASIIDAIFGDYAQMMINYTLELDKKLEAHQKALEEEKRRQEEEAARIAEEERLKAEEEEKRRQAEEAARIAEEERLKAEQEKKEKIKSTVIKASIIGGAGLLVLIILISAIKRRRRAKAKARAARAARNKNSYTPKH